MTKFEWERQLKKGISGLPKQEQQRVLDYYNELFADKIDAGLREQYIISEFGNPYDVANKILVDYYNEGKDNPSVDEYIFSSSDEIDEAFDEPTDSEPIRYEEQSWKERREQRRDERRREHEQRQAKHADVYDDETDEDRKKKNKGAISASGLIAIICVAVYLVLGACFNMWHPGWLIFLAMPCVITLIEAINKRNWKIFAYPVFAVLVFLLIGFYGKKWHPGWIIFITIPLYYVLGDFITKNADGNKTAKTEKEPRKEKQTKEQTRDTERVEKSKNVKGSKSESAANVISIIAKVLMTICFVWVSVVVWSFVIGLFCGGIGMIIGGVASLVGAAATGSILAVGAGLAVLGLGLICAFGMVALFKPCFNMCKSFVKTIKKSFDGKENA